MNILFVHSNYPAQFVHLAGRLGSQNCHNIVFLTNRPDPELWPLEGVNVRRFDLHRDVSQNIHEYVRPMEESVLRGQAVVRELLQLRSQGFVPQLIFFHIGNGLGMFMREVFPSALIVGYAEWWFNPSTTKWLVNSYSFNDQLRSRIRNLISLSEMDISDAIVTPTEWQKSQFPVHHQTKIKVLFDGIDTSFYTPGRVDDYLVLGREFCDEPLELLPDQLVLTYATRGMEPLRGFPEFMRMLPELLNRFPNLVVVIAGRDKNSYSYPSSLPSGSWKQYMLNELKDKCNLERIYFTGLLNLGDYRNLLWRTDLHVYFSRSYITSWGLFQALSCGAPVLVNRDPCIDYLFDDLYPLRAGLDDPESLVQLSCEHLTKPRDDRRRLMYQLQSKYSLDNCLGAWELFVRSLLT